MTYRMFVLVYDVSKKKEIKMSETHKAGIARAVSDIKASKIGAREERGNPDTFTFLNRLTIGETVSRFVNLGWRTSIPVKSNTATLVRGRIVLFINKRRRLRTKLGSDTKVQNIVQVYTV